MYQRILIPLENQDQQQPALDHARELAQITGGVVILAWMVPVLASEEKFFSQIQVEPGSSGARRVTEGEAFLAEAVEAFKTVGVEVVVRVVVTPLLLEQAIMELATEERADLIILTTLTQSAVGRFLFGSVGEKVRRRSLIPVLFVNAAQAGEGGEGVS